MRCEVNNLKNSLECIGSWIVSIEHSPHKLDCLKPLLRCAAQPILQVIVLIRQIADRQGPSVEGVPFHARSFPSGNRKPIVLACANPWIMDSRPDPIQTLRPFHFETECFFLERRLGLNRPRAPRPHIARILYLQDLTGQSHPLARNWPCDTQKTQQPTSPRAARNNLKPGTDKKE